MHLLESKVFSFSPNAFVVEKFDKAQNLLVCTVSKIVVKFLRNGMPMVSGLLLWRMLVQCLADNVSKKTLLTVHISKYNLSKKSIPKKYPKGYFRGHGQYFFL